MDGRPSSKNNRNYIKPYGNLEQIILLSQTKGLAFIDRRYSIYT